MKAEPKITAIKAFQDNYIWCMHDDDKAVVVDPGDHQPVQRFLNENGLSLDAILVTHHHYDHTGGILPLLDHWPNVKVYGPTNPKISGVTKRLKQGDTVRFFWNENQIDESSQEFQVLETPGHTLDHIAFVSQTILFCGDTLFSAGCGRMFEGTPEVFYDSLQKLSRLPEHLRVYCTHEYTSANVDFALNTEPDNETLCEYAEWVSLRREDGKMTLPSTIKLERKINPFLHCNSAENFANLRKAKDNY